MFNFQLMSGNNLTHGEHDVDEEICDFGDVDCGEMEALIVVRDKGGKGMTQCTTSLVPEDDDGEHV